MFKKSFLKQNIQQFKIYMFASAFRQLVIFLKLGPELLTKYFFYLHNSIFIFKQCHFLC